jgi:hypothetical protein
VLEIRPESGTGRCRLCQKVQDPSHYHTPWQILLWLWDGSLAAKLLITTGGVWLTGGLAFLLAYLRDNL